MLVAIGGKIWWQIADFRCPDSELRGLNGGRIERYNSKYARLKASLGQKNTIDKIWRTLSTKLFMRTTDLVQRLQVARRELGLEAAITKLDKYQLLILDDIAYVTKDQAETSVLFELIAARY
jgi:DNA replication protein DnaC